MINVVTILERYEAAAAFPQALFMATALMTVVLMRSNREYMASYLSYSTAALIPLYVLFFVRVSEIITNPAGTTGWLFCLIVHRGMSLCRRHMSDDARSAAARRSGKRGDILPFIGELA